jgi:hypothetical protein
MVTAAIAEEVWLPSLAPSEIERKAIVLVHPP